VNEFLLNWGIPWHRETWVREEIKLDIGVALKKREREPEEEGFLKKEIWGGGGSP